MFDSRRGPADSPNTLSVGKTVYDANLTKIGSVSAHDQQAGYFVAQKGMVFQQDLYIPLVAISRTDASGVYLNLTKEQLKDERYATAPRAAGTTPTARPAATAAATTSTDIGTPSTRAADRAGVDRVDRVDRVDGGGDAERRLGTASQPDVSSLNAGRRDVDDISVPIREETLIANKTREQSGNVRVHRYVVQEDQTIATPVSHEEVSIEHVAASNLPVDSDAFTEKDIEVPVMTERVNLGTEAHVVEEVHIHKRLVTEQQHASGKVRKEHIRVEGDAQDLGPRGDLPRDRDLPQNREGPRY